MNSIESEIIEYVCQQVGIDKEKIKSRKRTRDYVKARKLIHLVFNKHLCKTLESTGKYTGRDHATVLTQVQDIHYDFIADKRYKELYNTVKEKWNL